MKRNRIKCLQCNTILESKYRHDIASCNCENATYVDGGLDYCRIGGKDLNLISILSDDGKERPINS